MGKKVTRKTNRLPEITEDDIKAMHEENTKMIEKFIGYKRATDKSPASLKVYRSNLNIFFNWIRLYADNIPFYEIDDIDIVTFQGWCMEQGMSPSRIRHLRSTISSLSDYVIKVVRRRDDNYRDFENYVALVEAPKNAPVREKTILEEEDVSNLLDALVEDKKYQHACMVAALVSSGARKSEIIQAKVSWFVGDDVVIADGKYVSPKIRTKGDGRLGNMMEKFFIKQLFDPYLKLWLAERERLGIDHEDLFVRRINGEWTSIQQSTVDSWMNTCSRYAGQVIYAHAFRHYISTWLTKNGADISQVQDFHGHKDSSTTEIYIDIDKTERLKGMLDFMNDD